MSCMDYRLHVLYITLLFHDFTGERRRGQERAGKGKDIDGSVLGIGRWHGVF